MLIAVAGIKRSGSTAQFNMIRLCLEAYFGKEFVYTTGNPKEAIELNKSDRIVICKYHPFDKRLYNQSDFVFTTSRPLEEVKASMLRFYGIGNMPKRGLSVMKNHLASWQSRSFNQTFGIITNQPFIALNQIVEELKLDFFKEDIREIYNEFLNIKPPKEGYDKETFMFSNHITK